MRKREYGETDEIISLLSSDFGNKKIIVKGVRKLKGSLVGKFELFCTVRVLLATGRTFDVCTQVEVLSSHPRLREHLPRMTYGLYFLELFDTLLFFSEPQRSYFLLLEEALARLEYESRYELLTAFVMFNFLRLLGYRPVIDECTGCGRRLEVGAPPAGMYFSVVRGGLLCGNCLHHDRSAIRLEKSVNSAFEDLQMLSSQKINTSGITEDMACKMRKIFERYIAGQFSKVLRSSHLIGKVNQLERLTQGSVKVMKLPSLSPLPKWLT